MSHTHTHAHGHICKSIYLSFKSPTASEFHLSEYLMDTGSPLARDKAGRV